MNENYLFKNLEEKKQQTFQIFNENHCLANTIKNMCNLEFNNAFCAYSMNHPSDDIINLRIQTKNEEKSVLLLRRSLNKLKILCSLIKKIISQKVTRERFQNTKISYLKGETSILPCYKK